MFKMFKECSLNGLLTSPLFQKMAMKYEDLSPRTREQADDMDKDDVEWNKAIKETLDELIKMETHIHMSTHKFAKI